MPSSVPQRLEPSVCKLASHCLHTFVHSETCGLGMGGDACLRL